MSAGLTTEHSRRTFTSPLSAPLLLTALDMESLGLNPEDLNPHGPMESKRALARAQSAQVRETGGNMDQNLSLRVRVTFPTTHMKLSSKRINNVKPFVVAGISTALNLSSQQDNPDDNSKNVFRVTKNNMYYELGMPELQDPWATPTLKVTNLQYYKLTNLQTYKLAKLQTYKLTNLQSL